MKSFFIGFVITCRHSKLFQLWSPRYSTKNNRFRTFSHEKLYTVSSIVLLEDRWFLHYKASSLKCYFELKVNKQGFITTAVVTGQFCFPGKCKNVIRTNTRCQITWSKPPVVGKRKFHVGKHCNFQYLYILNTLIVI